MAPARGVHDRLRALCRAAVVTAPVAVLLLDHRLHIGGTYAAYSLPILGAFPKGIIFDLSLLACGLLAWSVVSRFTVARRAYLATVIPILLFVVVFRVADFYYYSAVHVDFNAAALYGNLGFVQEGAGVVLASPSFLVLACIVVGHAIACLVAPAYRRVLAALGDALAASPRAVGSIAGLVLVFGGINAHAVLVGAKRRDTVRSMSGEYVLLQGLPRLYRTEWNRERLVATRPAKLYLPEPTSRAPSSVAGVGRQNVFLIFIESFNYAYLEPDSLNPRLTRDVMPFFRALVRDGYLFTNVYTSAAFTINGYVATLCSQPTISEVVWGGHCLPELLRARGYDAAAFISIGQLLPRHIAALRAAGFAEHQVFDAVRMRDGRQNVYFDFMMDRELFDYAAAASTRLARHSGAPFFLQVATNQMHVPGYYQDSACPAYPLPAGVAADAQTRRMLSSAYCTDRDLHRFIGQLKADGLYDDALIVIVADHAINIRFWKYEEPELSRIPLFIKLPRGTRLRQPVDTARLASQVDVMPTILDVLGIHTDRAMYGRSLFGPADPARRVVPGVSASGLISLATSRGIARYEYGRLSGADSAAGIGMLYETVLYFDQHPALFRPLARRPAAGADSTRYALPIPPRARPTVAARR